MGAIRWPFQLDVRLNIVSLVRQCGLDCEGRGLDLMGSLIRPSFPALSSGLHFSSYLEVTFFPCKEENISISLLRPLPKFHEELRVIKFKRKLIKMKPRERDSPIHNEFKIDEHAMRSRSMIAVRPHLSSLFLARGCVVDAVDEQHAFPPTYMTCNRRRA